jgi:hypothetical protein
MHGALHDGGRGAREQPGPDHERNDETKGTANGIAIEAPNSLTNK